MIEKILAFFGSIDKDKWMHFTICLIVSLLAGIVARLLYHLSVGEIVCVSWTVGYIVGLGKEVYDEIKTKSSDPYDWAADFLGSTFGTVIVLLLVI